MSISADRVLEECIQAIRPYLDQLVVAGGWVPSLYVKLYEGSATHEPLLTVDFDAVIARHAFVEHSITLDKTILSAGFNYDFASLDIPPVVKYVKNLEDNQQAEIEFLTEAGAAKRPVEVIGSINAQALQYIDVLLDEPWSFPLEDYALTGSECLKVPRPSQYVLHKILVAPRRKGVRKTAKDLYYAFYVLDAFPAWRAEILDQLSHLSRQKNAQAAATYLATMFADIDSPGVEHVVSQRPQTAYATMTDDQFRQYCMHRMSELRSALLRP